MSIYAYQTMLLRKFYKFIKFKTVSKMFAANSPYVGPDSTRRAKFECGFQHWTIMSSNLTNLKVTMRSLHLCMQWLRNSATGPVFNKLKKR